MGADIGGIGRQRATLEAMQEVGKDTAAELRGEQATAAKNAQATNARTAFRARTKRPSKQLKARRGRVAQLLKMRREKQMLPVEQIKDSANRFQQKNRELKADSLTLLRQQIRPGATKEEILAHIKRYFPDVSLTDEVFDFLLETTEGELHQQVRAAKEEHFEQNEREIKAGRNIMTRAQQAADQGLGSPTSMRDLYRDITGNPRDSQTLFDELSKQYAFKELNKVANFLLHSLGADMKAKGPSIEPGQLHRLIKETRSLQAILGVYRFFSKRMALMNKLFAKSGLAVPSQLTFETMAKQFMALVRDRYPSGDKVLQSAKRLGIEDWILAKIIAFSQFRDSIRELAMSQIFRSLQHRDELFQAIIEALEELEDELEEEEEEEEDEE